MSIAVAGSLLLAAAIGAVVLSGGSESPAPSPPPPGCLKRWNYDSSALIYGRHNYAGHRYTSAQVRMLSGRGEEPDAGERRHCVVVFPAPVLDPEPFFAGQIYADERWRPLAKLPGLPDVRLAELQVEAQAGANALLRLDGTLVPLD